MSREMKMCIDRKEWDKLLSGSQDNLECMFSQHLDFYQFIGSVNSLAKEAFMAECDWITLSTNHV